MTEDELRRLLALTQVRLAPAPIADEENQPMAEISAKGFDIIAASIKDLPLVENHICTSNEDANALRSFLANYLAGDLRRTNARFDRYRFVAACIPKDDDDGGDDPPDEDDAELARYDALDDDLDNPEEDR